MQLGNIQRYSFKNYVFLNLTQNRFFKGYPQKELLYLAQNLGVEATTDGCSRQCKHCGVNPPYKIKVMPFWMVKELAPLSLRILPYLRSEPFDYFDPKANKDISDVVEENFKYLAQTQITTAFWDKNNPIANYAAQKIKIEHTDDFRLSIHLFWPKELLEQRKDEIINGCQIFWQRGYRNLVSRITYDSQTESATRKFVQKLEEMFPGLFLESRKLFVPIVNVGRAHQKKETNTFGEVFFNKLVLMPDGYLSIFYRKGNFYRFHHTGLSLLEPFNFEKYTNFVLTVQKFLPIRAQAYQSSKEFIEDMKSKNWQSYPEIKEILVQKDLKSICKKFMEIILQTPKMSLALHKFCHDIFSFNEPEIEEMVTEVFQKEASIQDVEVVRRAIEFVLRQDKLRQYAKEITNMVIRRVFGKGIINDEISFQIPLLDVLGFLPENKNLLKEWQTKLDDLPCTSLNMKEKIKLTLARLINRIDFITSGQFPD